MMPYILVGAGGFLGAASRYGIAQWAAKRIRSSLPAGTLIVNLLGSFLLGWIAGLQVAELALFFGTGFMGAFTTFSTFKVEGLRFWQASRFKELILYYMISYTGGIALAFLGFLLGRWIG